MIKANFHTHSCYCDGKDTPRELALYAFEHGFESLGFSGHSYLECDSGCSMSGAELESYIADTAELRKEYEGRLNIFAGLEQDIFSKPPSFDFDFLIGSVHYIEKDGKLLPVDLSAELQQRDADRYYGGDFDAYAEDYFAEVADVISRTGADIIGHFDLVSKFFEKTGRTESERYLEAAEKAVRKLISFGKPFEINTGAMASGLKSCPYPSEKILSLISGLGGSIIISSDCHDKNFLDFGFKEAEALAKKTGFAAYGMVTAKSLIEYFPF